ncbi:MAG: hypothetical protein AB8H79_24805 [Myxococcota bacterium]
MSVQTLGYRWGISVIGLAVAVVLAFGSSHNYSYQIGNTGFRKQHINSKRGPSPAPISTPQAPLTRHSGIVSAQTESTVDFPPFDTAPVVGTRVTLTRSARWYDDQAQSVEGTLATGVIAEVSEHRVRVDVTHDAWVRTIDGQRQPNFEVGQSANLYWASSAVRADAMGESL